MPKMRLPFSSLPKIASLLFGFLLRKTHGADILIIGDSKAEFAENHLQTYCAGSTTFNFGVGGQKASEWESGVPGGAESAFDRTYDAVYFSIGGNDFFGNGCAGSVATAVKSALDTVVARIGDSVPIVMIGYCAPTACQAECPTDPTTWPGLLQNSIKDACDQVSSCTFEDAWEACDYDGQTGYSVGAYHIDPIHLNSVGYCKMLSTLQDFRNALQCTSEPSCPNGPGSCQGGGGGGEGMDVFSLLFFTALLVLCPLCAPCTCLYCLGWIG